MMRKSIIIAITCMLAMCGASSCKHTDKGEEAAAEIEAATIDGREAARIFVNRPWKDTVELQRQLLEARARQSKYSVAGKHRSAAAFDSAFVSTLKTVRPEMARELEKAAVNRAKEAR